MQVRIWTQRRAELGMTKLQRRGLSSAAAQRLPFTTWDPELHIGIISTADFRWYFALYMAATAHARASSGSRWRLIASMPDLLRRQLVHPARRTSLHLCAGTSDDEQQWEVGAETPRRDSLYGDEGRSCLCNTADFQATCTLCGFALQQY
jgi:hypothetical protein